VLQGDVPSFRDLGPGVAGEDVRQLEQALARLGFDPGAVDGVFDDATGVAVTALYTSAGFQPIVATDRQLADLQTPDQALIPNNRSTAGVQVAADEIAFVPSTPVRVAEFELPLGDAVEGIIVTVTDATIYIDASVPIEQAGLIMEGMKVVIDEPDLGIEATGTISIVAPGPGTDDVDGFHVYFEVLVDESPPALINASVRVRVPIQSTGEPVLAVPVSALSLGPDGSSRVQRKSGDALTYVTVEPGLSAQGFAAVTPVSGELNPGDLVVIGFDQPAS
jgi:multidrug efflux pump subunit AcrA (membrane-fusion protein)